MRHLMTHDAEMHNNTVKIQADTAKGTGTLYTLKIAQLYVTRLVRRLSLICVYSILHS